MARGPRNSSSAALAELMPDQTVVVLLCGCRWDYVDVSTTPFLASLRDVSYSIRKVQPGWGFCERTEILTGLPSLDQDFLFAIGRDTTNSPYKRLRPVLGVMQQISNRSTSERFDYAARRLLWAFISQSNHPMRPYNIPFSMLSDYRLTEDFWLHDEPESFQTPSIFDLLRRRGLRWGLDSFTSLHHRRGSNDSARQERALMGLRSGNDMQFVYFGGFDEYGHLYGPDSDEFRSHLKRLDTALAKFVAYCERVNPGVRVLLVGDHGMSQVNESLDVGRIFNQVKQTVKSRGGWLEFFLDSTMARLWIAPGFEQIVMSELETSSSLFRYGSLLPIQELVDRQSTALACLYGSHIWTANEGTVVSPDFFHKRSQVPKGMHGYSPDLASSHGVLLTHGLGDYGPSEDFAPLTKIFDVLRFCMSDRSLSD